jgi:hypothetical protein
MKSISGLFNLAKNSENPDYRRQYLETLDLEDSKKFVLDLRYVDLPCLTDTTSITLARTSNGCLTHLLAKLLGIPGTPSEITVYSSAFDVNTTKTEDDFKLILEHELKHAWQYFTHPLKTLFSKKRAEKEAYEHELELINSGKYTSSKENLEKIKKNLESVSN